LDRRGNENLMETCPGDSTLKTVDSRHVTVARESDVFLESSNINTVDAEPHIKLIKGRRGWAYACMQGVK
jgi:hypothetical protein